MPTTHTAQHLNSRHHQHGTQVTDRDGDTWTRVKTSHGTYWEHDGSRCRNLPKLYEPYTYKNTRKDTYREELDKAIDAYLNAEKLHGQGTTNPPQPQSQGLFQTIPSTWTKPTNLLPATTKTRMANWEKLYSHYKNLGQTNPEPLTKNMLKTAQHIFGIDEATGNNEHVHWAPNPEPLTKNIHFPHATPKIQGMTATHTTTDEIFHTTNASPGINLGDYYHFYNVKPTEPTQPTNKRFIIAIEGIDGAGKNTTTKQLAKLLNATTITFPQYGKTQAAHQITQHLKTGTLNPWHAAQLFAQDRAQTPIPTTGTIIIDRYTASNAAYLTAKTGDPHALQAIEDLEHTTLKLPKPNLYILIDTPVDTAMHRTKQRANTHGEEPDTNETDRALQHKVRETYLNMAQTNWVSPWIILNPHTTKD